MDNIQKIHNDLFEHLRTKYPDLRFSLRQSNRYKYLDKGYWFWGDDTNIEVSFWKGMDWLTQTQNIALKIDLLDILSPRVRLEFVASDDIQKTNFFEEIAFPLRMFQLRINGKLVNQWTKLYNADIYLDAVDLFIETDKIIIDSFIRSSRVNNLFPYISQKQFDKNIKEIEARRAFRANLVENVSPLLELSNAYYLRKGKSILIDRLIINGIAQFKMLSVEFNPNLTCFIGENGSGKTTLLRSILLGLIGVGQNEYLAENKALTESLVNLLRIKGLKEDSDIEYSGFGEIELYCNKKSKSSGVKFIVRDQGQPKLIDQGSFEDQIDERGNFSSLVIGFSQAQSLGNKFKGFSSEKPNVEDVLPLLANEPDGRGEALHKWLMSLDHDASNKEKEGQFSIERQLINRMFEIISDVTGQKLSFNTVNAQKEIIWIDIDGQTIPLRLVSQGFNNVFSWIGYFMKRLSETAPEGTEDPTQLPAICLIDEIDTYLHPLWQQTIVPALLKHFPNTQFIITTHSPIVVSNMEQGKLYKLENGEAIEIPAGYFGKDYGLVLEAVMGTPPRNEKSRKALADLFELIDREDFDAARQKLSELEEEYPGEPELSRAETLLSFLEA